MQIVDNQTPLLVLFGPSACGKTMTLKVIAGHLRNVGCSISPIETFRPASDLHYRDLCNNFGDWLDRMEAAPATARQDTILVGVRKDNRQLCQVVDMAGEYCFSPGLVNNTFSQELQFIINSPNRKIWMIMLEPEGTNKSMDEAACHDYVNTVRRLRYNMTKDDKVIFVYNKIDESGFEMRLGEVDEMLAIKDIERRYVGIFEPFKNVNSVTRLFKRYDFDFVPFMTGQFFDNGSFTEGHYSWCERLWSVVQKSLKIRV